MVLSGLYRVRSCKLMGKPASALRPCSARPVLCRVLPSFRWVLLGCQVHGVPLPPCTGTAWSQSEQGPVSGLALGSPLCLHPKTWFKSKTPALAIKPASPELCSPEGMESGHQRDREGNTENYKDLSRELWGVKHPQAGFSADGHASLPAHHITRLLLILPIHPSLRKVCPGFSKGIKKPYDEMVIFVSVSCSTFFKFRPSLPIRRPTKLLWAKIFRGTSSALERGMGKKTNMKDYCSQKRTDSVQRDGGSSSPLDWSPWVPPNQSSCTHGSITRLRALGW